AVTTLAKRPRDHYAPADQHDGVEHRGVHVYRQALDDEPRHERARETDAADHQPDQQYGRRDRAGDSEHREFDDAHDDGDQRIGGDHRGAFEADGHQERQQDDAGAGGAADQNAPAGRRPGKTLFAEPVATLLQHPAQRHGGDQGRPDDDGGAAAGQERIEPGAEHAGWQRRDERNDGGAHHQLVTEGEDARRIGEQGRDGNDRHHRRSADDR